MKSLLIILLSISYTINLLAQSHDKILLAGQTLEAFQGYLLDENNKALSKQISIIINPQLSTIESPKSNGKFLFGVNKIEEIKEVKYEVTDYEILNTVIDSRNRKVFVKVKPKLTQQLQKSILEIKDFANQIKQTELSELQIKNFKDEIQSIDNQLIKRNDISIEKLTKLEGEVKNLEKNQANNPQNQLAISALQEDIKSIQLGLSLKKLLLNCEKNLQILRQKQSQTNIIVYTILAGILLGLSLTFIQMRKLIKNNLLKINELQEKSQKLASENQEIHTLKIQLMEMKAKLKNQI